ncbi:GAF domain-containing sensor histidine kinase [bacterium]|nr:MAG: GAF domain-containing sensor histidine kinase [bacterium]
MNAPLPPDEGKRLEALHAYRILDTPREIAFDDIAELAALICGLPIAAISLIDEKRQWFKAIVGLEATELPREIAFCAYAILEPDEIMEVSDAAEDPRFASNELVTHAPFLRFYAGASLIDPEGHPLGTVCVAGREPHRLTPENRRALRALSRQATSLIQLHGTLQRAEQQTQDLRAAHLAAQTAAKTRDHFLAGIGHELRTPLNGVIGLTESLLHEPMTDPQCEKLTMIDRSGRALMRIVDDLLEFSQQQDPMGKTDPVVFRTLDLVTEVCDLYLPETRRKGVALTVQDQANTAVEAEASLIRRILTRLVDNSVKFTDEGAIAVAVRFDLPGRLRFEVRDSGIGVPEGQAEPFSSFEQGHRRERGGARLGLDSVQKLVARLGGRFGLNNRPEGGAIAWFEVPVVSASPTPDAPAPEAIPLVGKRALVVEDNPVNTLVIRMMMERLGIEVDTAENGFEGIEAAAADGYDLILMDVQMPKMDGIEAARRIRMWEPNVPIVAVTASSVAADRQACRDAGMQGYLVKPVTEEALLAELRKALSGT